MKRTEYNRKKEGLTKGSKFLSVYFVRSILLLFLSIFLLLGISSNSVFSQEDNDLNKVKKNGTTIRDLNIEKLMDISKQNRFTYRIKVVTSEGTPISKAWIKIPSLKYRVKDLVDEKLDPALHNLKGMSPKKKLQMFKQSFGKPLIYGDSQANEEGIANVHIWVYNKSLKNTYANSPLVFHAIKEGFVDYGYGKWASNKEKKSSVSITGSANETVQGKIILYKGNIYKVKVKNINDSIKYIQDNCSFSMDFYVNGRLKTGEIVNVSNDGFLVDAIPPHVKPSIPDIPENGYVQIEMSISPPKSNGKEKPKYLPIKKKITKEDFEPGETIHLELKKNTDYQGK